MLLWHQWLKSPINGISDWHGEYGDTSLSPLHTRLLTGDPLHSRALAHSCAPLFTQPCPHCSHSRAPGEQWARLRVFTLQGCVQAARLCRGSPVLLGAWHGAYVSLIKSAATQNLLSNPAIIHTAMLLHIEAWSNFAANILKCIFFN